MRKIQAPCHRCHDESWWQWDGVCWTCVECSYAGRRTEMDKALFAAWLKSPAARELVRMRPMIRPVLELN